MTLFIIFTSLFVISMVLLLLCTIVNCDASMFIGSLIVLIVSGIGMAICSEFDSKKVKPIEYPVSEYDFKIKVVEFEEHRDTILVVTPKDKIK